MSITKKFDVFFDEDNNAYQIRTKSDIITIEFADNEKKDIFLDLLKLYDSKGFYSFKQLNKSLSNRHSHLKVLDVVQELLDCSILNDDNFETGEEISRTPTDYSFWSDSYCISDLKEKTLGFIGTKDLGQKIKEKAESYEYRGVELLTKIEGMDFKNAKTVIDKHDFIIVDASEWNPSLLNILNRECLKINKPWLLIDGLVDLTNYSIGPIFHGRYTGCYDCFKNRIRSNDEFGAFSNSYEQYLMKLGLSGKSSSVNNLIIDIVSSITIMDISKYLGGWYPPETWRATLVLNIQNYQISKHDFLKAPICFTCKPELDYNTSPWLESITLKEKRT